MVSTPDRFRFTKVLLLITVLAFAVRVGYVVFEQWDEPLVGDEVTYRAAADRLADGDGFVVPYDAKRSEVRGTEPAADHPPMTVMVLAPVSWVSGSDANALRLTMALLGTVAVGLVGLLGRAIAGDRAGLIAAGIAAVYPNLWVNDGLVMSETLAVLAVVLALLLAYRFMRHPAAGTALALGVVCGAAALIRVELLLLIPLLLVPTVLLVRTVTQPEQVQNIVISVAAVALILGPWVVFNLGRFERPTLVSTNDGAALLGANCDPAYYGDATGSWDARCLPAVRGDQSTVNAQYRRDALKYMRDQADRVPAVVVARMGRTWGLFEPGGARSLDERDGRPSWVTTLGLWSYYPLLVLAISGAIVMRRRFDHLWQLLVPVVLVTVVSIVIYGQTRFRVPAEPSIVVLAAIALDAFFPGKIVARGGREAQPTTGSAQTSIDSSSTAPNVETMATSRASRPRPISTRPILG